MCKRKAWDFFCCFFLLAVPQEKKGLGAHLLFVADCRMSRIIVRTSIVDLHQGSHVVRWHRIASPQHVDQPVQAANALWKKVYNAKENRSKCSYQSRQLVRQFNAVISEIPKCVASQCKQTYHEYCQKFHCSTRIFIRQYLRGHKKYGDC